MKSTCKNSGTFQGKKFYPKKSLTPVLHQAVQFMNKLEDLDFADDMALVASRIMDMQTKLENLNINRKKTALKINHANEMEC